MLLVAVLGCRSPEAVRAPTPAVAAPTPPPAAYTLPAARKPIATHLVCDGSDAGTTRITTYDFVGMVIHPVRRGARSRERPRGMSPRSAEQIGQLFAARFDGLEGCWKWASARGAAATTATLRMTVDPTGRVRDASVEPRSLEVAGCIARQLVGATVSHPAARATRVKLPLVFERVNQPAWPRPPAPPPDPITARPSNVCAEVLDDGASDVLELAVPLELSDRDPAREPRVPSVRIGCSSVRPALTKRDVLDAFRANVGAFQSCFASARERDPTLHGTATLHVAFGTSGGAVTASADGDGDGQLHACLTAAGRELFVEPPVGHGIVVNLPLELDPGPDDELDPNDALAMLEKKLREPHVAAERCSLLADVAAISTEVAPWLDDDRVLGAMRDVVRAILALPAVDRAACLTDVASTLERLAVSPYDRRAWSNRRRAEILEPIVDELSEATMLFVARELAVTSRRDVGFAHLTRAMERTLDPDRRLSLEAQRDGLRGRVFGRCGLQ